MGVVKPSHNMQTTNARDRSYYERQGAEALAGQAGFHCSDDTVVSAVMEMAIPYLAEFGVAPPADHPIGRRP